MNTPSINKTLLLAAVVLITIACLRLAEYPSFHPPPPFSDVLISEGRAISTSLKNENSTPLQTARIEVETKSGETVVFYHQGFPEVWRPAIDEISGQKITVWHTKIMEDSRGEKNAIFWQVHLSPSKSIPFALLNMISSENRASIKMQVPILLILAIILLIARRIITRRSLAGERA